MAKLPSAFGISPVIRSLIASAKLLATIKSRLRSVVSNWLRSLSNSCTVYSLSEALILASINPKYGD